MVHINNASDIMCLYVSILHVWVKWYDAFFFGIYFKVGQNVFYVAFFFFC